MTEIIKYTASGRKEFIGLLHPCIKKLNSLAMFLCKNSYKADELVSETVAKACVNFHRLRDKTKFKQWIFRIMNNEFINLYRLEKNVSIDTDYTDDLPENYSLSSRNLSTINGWGPDPESKFINNLIDNDIKSAISSLREDFRIAVVLSDVENFSYKEISQILNIPIGTVRSRLSRGRAILQMKLRIHAVEMGVISESHQKFDLCECGDPHQKIVRN